MYSPLNWPLTPYYTHTNEKKLHGKTGSGKQNFNSIANCLTRIVSHIRMYIDRFFDIIKYVFENT